MECHTSLSTVLVYVGHGGENVHAATFKLTSRVPVDGKSSVCVICMKYRIIFLIIIFISLGQIILSYMANTSRTHAGTHAHTRAPAHTHRRAHGPTHRRHHPGYRCYMGGVRPTRTKIRPLFACSAGYEWPVGVIFFPINAPGMGRFQLLNLGGLGYGLELRFWVVISSIIVSLTLTITLITTLTII